ncbi:MAG: hypothetical protein ACK4NC_02630 [Candidatus Gracilibacteria bacterium]
MSSRSGSLAREVLTIVLFFLCIISGGIYLSLHKEKPAAIQLAFGGEESTRNENVALQVPVNENIVPAVVNQNVVTSIPVQENLNTTKPQANQNAAMVANQNANAVVPTSTNNGTTTNPVSQASLQAYAQTTLGKNYLVVKTEYKENRLYETLTPYATAVKVERYILQKNGNQVGFLYEIKKVDPTIRNVNLFLRDLAQRVLQNPKITVSDAAFGRRGFYYNNIDKPELLRIVVESKTGANYAVDVVSSLKEDFNEFFRSL